MNITLVKKIADVVLYEGYILYPYRASTVKNRQRFNFGVLTPKSYSEAQHGTEACRMQTECLVTGNNQTILDVKVRFLHLLMREIGRLTSSEDEHPKFEIVESLEVRGHLYQTWQEAIERETDVTEITIDELLSGARRMLFWFPAKQETAPLEDEQGKLVGLLYRERQPVEGVIEVKAECVQDNLFKVTVEVENLTGFDDPQLKSRDEALMRSMTSTHTLLAARAGEFISLLDPPEHFSEAVSLCNNIGTFPVLAGEEGERDIMLSSPIILYDYPQIAPESAGELFDGTEIDEILILRILTMTDQEKREMRHLDEQARRILERTESLPAEKLMKLHGTIRELRPVEYSKGRTRDE